MKLKPRVTILLTQFSCIVSMLHFCIPSWFDDDVTRITSIQIQSYLVVQDTLSFSLPCTIEVMRVTSSSNQEVIQNTYTEWGKKYFLPHTCLDNFLVWWWCQQYSQLFVTRITRQQPIAHGPVLYILRCHWPDLNIPVSCVLIGCAARKLVLRISRDHNHSRWTPKPKR